MSSNKPWTELYCYTSTHGTSGMLCADLLYNRKFAQKKTLWFSHFAGHSQTLSNISFSFCMKTLVIFSLTTVASYSRIMNVFFCTNFPLYSICILYWPRYTSLFVFLEAFSALLVSCGLSWSCDKPWKPLCSFLVTPATVSRGFFDVF